ncbi:hypothetical protein [Enterovirga sp. CN4-39]|uniref:hypothetical protein n=1 Tax=Enterovirga sp. CN4-39 TaxID=3400910 RepID=UPI003C2D85E8
MAGIPGWSIFLDPAYLSGGALINRALPNNVTQNLDAAQTPATFSNDAPALSMTSARRVQPNTAVDPNVWTFFWVINGSTPTSLMDLAGSVTPATSPNLSLKIGISSDGARTGIYPNTATVTPRLAYTPGSNLFGRTALLMYTFSTRDGLRIYENGNLVATDASDKTPLTSGYTAGQWRLFTNARGLIGMTGHLNIDLSWPEYAAQRVAMETFLKAKYGIT